MNTPLCDYVKVDWSLSFSNIVILIVNKKETVREIKKYSRSLLAFLIFIYIVFQSNRFRQSFNMFTFI